MTLFSTAKLLQVPTSASAARNQCQSFPPCQTSVMPTVSAPTLVHLPAGILFVQISGSLLLSPSGVQVSDARGSVSRMTS
jgi:hypothetical protein